MLLKKNIVGGQDAQNASADTLAFHDTNTPDFQLEPASLRDQENYIMESFTPTTERIDALTTLVLGSLAQDLQQHLEDERRTAQPRSRQQYTCHVCYGPTYNEFCLCGRCLDIGG